MRFRLVVRNEQTNRNFNFSPVKGADSMRRIAFTAALLIAVSLVVLGQLGCQPAADTNRAVSSPETNTNSTKETVDTAAIESELMRIENDWPRVIREKDIEAIRRVEADDIAIVYPDGSVGNKEQDVNDVQSGALSADAWEVADLKVTVLDNDAAFVSGRNIVKGGKYKTPDGKVKDISGQSRFIDTFARRNGQWKLVAGIGTPVQHPEAAAASSPAAMASPTAKASPTPQASPTVRAPAATASPAMKPPPSPKPKITP
jgi:ketosteroid isomerase-like protein